MMDEPGFWRAAWEQDLKAPARDFIKQAFYVVLTAVLQLLGRLLDATGVAPWLGDLIHLVFDALTVVALGQLVIPMALRMLRSGIKSVRGSHE